jgi:hypothetical protein
MTEKRLGRYLTQYGLGRAIEYKTFKGGDGR